MRQRILTPAMFGDEATLALSLPVRWTLAGLKLMADDRGIVEDDVNAIRKEVWNGRNEPISSMLLQLENAGFILRFQGEYVPSIAILDFIPEQKPRQGRMRIAIPIESKARVLEFIGWNKVTPEQRKFFVAAGAKGDFSEVAARPKKPQWRADNAKAPRKVATKHGVPRTAPKSMFDVKIEPAANKVTSIVEVQVADRRLKEIDFKAIETAWNTVCTPLGLERCDGVTNNDRRQIIARMNEAPELVNLSGWVYYFLRIVHTKKIMNGEAGITMRKDGWRPDFKWAVSSGAWLKVRERTFGRPNIPEDKLEEFGCRHMATPDAIAA